MNVKSKLIAEKGKLLLNTSQAVNLIDIHQLVASYKIHHFVMFIMADQSSTEILFPFEEIVELLKDESFILTTPEHLINLKYLENIPDLKKNYVQMVNDITVPIDNEKKALIISAIELYNKQ
jgi:hypothetical protein